MAQLIIDPNGEYANDNPQDAGCLRNVKHLPGADPADVVTYGLTSHPNDPERRITKMNFFGQELPQPRPRALSDLDQYLQSLYMGKQIIDGRLENEGAGYIAAFRTTDMTAPGSVTDYGEYVRYRRAVFVYQAILAAAGFEGPNDGVSANGLFSQEVRDAMRNDGYAVQLQDRPSWDSAIAFCKDMSEWFRQGKGRTFDRAQAARSNRDGRNWSDDRLLGLLRIFENTRGVQALRECREWHDPNRNADYTDEIVADLKAGKLVILDQALGDPVMNEQSAERIMRKIFTRQQQRFTNPDQAPDGTFLQSDPVIVYVEEAHTLLPRGSEEDTRNIWSRTARRAPSSTLASSIPRKSPHPSSATFSATPRTGSSPTSTAPTKPASWTGTTTSPTSAPASGASRSQAS